MNLIQTTITITVGYLFLGQLAFYRLVHSYAIKTASFSSKFLIAFSLLCCFTALVILNIDISQSLRLQGAPLIDLTPYGRFFYWSSFLFGYVIFVVRAERERLGNSDNFFLVWLNFYRRQLLLFVMIAFSVVFLVVYLLKNKLITW